MTATKKEDPALVRRAPDYRKNSRAAFS